MTAGTKAKLYEIAVMVGDGQSVHAAMVTDDERLVTVCGRRLVDHVQLVLTTVDCVHCVDELRGRRRRRRP